MPPTSGGADRRPGGETTQHLRMSDVTGWTCPTCGRLQFDMDTVVAEIEQRLEHERLLAADAAPVLEQIVQIDGPRLAHDVVEEPAALVRPAGRQRLVFRRKDDDGQHPYDVSQPFQRGTIHEQPFAFGGDVRQPHLQLRPPLAFKPSLYLKIGRAFRIFQVRQHLLQNPQTLVHLIHPHQITVIHIPVIPHRHIKIQMRVIRIRVSPPQIIIDTTRPQHRPGNLVYIQR